MQSEWNIYPMESELMSLHEIHDGSVSQCSILASSKGSQELLTHLTRACDDVCTISFCFWKDKEVSDFRCSHID